MGFNCPEFIKEFKRYVDNLKVKAILEVGSYKCAFEVAKAMGRCCYEM